MKLYLRVYKEKREPAGNNGSAQPLAEGPAGTRYVGRMRVLGPNMSQEQEVSGKSVKELAGRIGDKLAEMEPSLKKSRLPEFAVQFAHEPCESAKTAPAAKSPVKVEKKIFSGREIAAFFSAIERALMLNPPLGA